MTFCKCLAESVRKDGKTVSAWENWDKYAKMPDYEITVSEGSYALESVKVSRTTWKRKFRQLVNE